jgi:hypothetical protein
VNSEGVPQALRGHVRSLGNGGFAHDALHELPSPAARDGPKSGAPILKPMRFVQSAEQFCGEAPRGSRRRVCAS